VKATPTAVLLDGAGVVRYHGQIDDNPEPVAVQRQYLREALDAVLSGREVPVAATLALGCAIRKGPDDAVPQGPVKLIDGLGRVRFPVTGSPEAQRFFEQGMAQFYGFNLPEAERTFREVVRIDPNAAIGYWGIALSLGPTYNHDNAPARFPEARA